MHQTIIQKMVPPFQYPLSPPFVWAFKVKRTWTTSNTNQIEYQSLCCISIKRTLVYIYKETGKLFFFSSLLCSWPYILICLSKLWVQVVLVSRDLLPLLFGWEMMIVVIIQCFIVLKIQSIVLQKPIDCDWPGCLIICFAKLTCECTLVYFVLFEEVMN